MHESPFRILVSDLAGHPGAHRSESLSGAIPLVLDMARTQGMVDVEVRLDAGSAEIVATGTVRFGMVTICNRCLVETEEEGSTRFSQVYRLAGSDTEVGEDDEELLTMDSHGWIDLESPIRDEVGLALPLKPLCRDDCLGLCPTCGTDLNTEPCAGHEDLSSSPFAVLQQFLDPQD